MNRRSFLTGLLGLAASLPIIRRLPPDPLPPLYLGADWAEPGGDRSVIQFRRYGKLLMPCEPLVRGTVPAPECFPPVRGVSREAERTFDAALSRMIDARHRRL